MIHDPSGLGLAEEAHAAGAVEPADEQPNFDVEISFVVRQHTRSRAEVIAETFCTELVARSDVERVTWSVTERKT